MRHSSARCLQVCRYPLRPTLPLGVCLLRMAERTQELTARSENQAVRRDERCGLTSVEPGLVSECLRCPGAKLASLLGAERACGHGEKGAVQRWQPVSVSNLQRTDDRGLEGNGPKTTSWRRARLVATRLMQCQGGTTHLLALRGRLRQGEIQKC